MRNINSVACHLVSEAAGAVVEGKYNWEYFLIMAQKFNYGVTSKSMSTKKNPTINHSRHGAIDAW